MSSLQYERVENNDELDKLFLKYFSIEARKNYIRMGKAKQVLPERYLLFAKAIEEMEVRSDDIWVVTHPKAGTTWSQEMVWCIVNDVDLETAKKIPLQDRFPFLELSTLFELPKEERDKTLNLSPASLDSVKYVADLPSPRLIKTHLQWSLLPAQIRNGEKKPKILYVARNAKDTCVSFYHHSRIISGFKGDLDIYCKMFLADKATYGPFWSHVLEFWKRREEENIMFIKYEDMKKDLPSVIREVAKFLQKDLTEEQVMRLNDHLTFEKMKDNPSVNYEEFVRNQQKLNKTQHCGQFMRRGQVGSWREEMTEEMSKKFDEWTKENLKNTGLEL